MGVLILCCACAYACVTTIVPLNTTKPTHTDCNHSRHTSVRAASTLSYGVAAAASAAAMPIATSNIRALIAFQFFFLRRTGLRTTSFFIRSQRAQSTQEISNNVNLLWSQIHRHCVDSRHCLVGYCVKSRTQTLYTHSCACMHTAGMPHAAVRACICVGCVYYGMCVRAKQ